MSSQLLSKKSTLLPSLFLIQRSRGARGQGAFAPSFTHRKIFPCPPILQQPSTGSVATKRLKIVLFPDQNRCESREPRPPSAGLPFSFDSGYHPGLFGADPGIPDDKEES